MRKVPVLTVVCLTALFAVLSAPAYASTALVSDTPGVILAPGATGEGAFNLNDFFDNGGPFTATGADVAEDGTVDVFGLAAAGETAAEFSNADGASTSVVKVSDFSLGNRPAIDNNNRIVGVPGGNMFVNLLIPGGAAVSSSLSGIPAGGGSASPGGASPGGAADLIATVGQVSVSVSDTGFRSRSSQIFANSGITAELSADGSYTLSAAADAAGGYIVTLGASAGASTDVVQLLAATAQEVGAPMVGTHTVAAGENSLLIGAEAVAIGQDAQISANYNASAVAGVAIAVGGFDGAVAFQNVSYTNQSGDQLEAGVTKNIATGIRSTAGSVIPFVQIFNGGSAPVTVTISDMLVANAGPLVDYALNVNAKALANGFASVDGVIADILGSGAAAPAADAANNFAGADGSMKLAGKGGVANGSLTASVGTGTAVAEAFYMRMGDADAGSTVTLNVTDGAGVSFASFTPGGAVPADGWWKAQASAAVTGDKAIFVTIQAAGVDVAVDDLSVRIVTDKDNQFDANLLG